MKTPTAVSYLDNSQINCPNTIPAWFIIFCVLHLAFWTLGPTLIRGTVTHDTVEGIAWGMQWQLGYDKHPPLAAWLCAAVTMLFGKVGWPVYLLAQLCVVTAFWAVWRLALYIVSPIQALISVLMLEGVVYYTQSSPNLTPDTMQTPIWALIIFTFYLSLIKKNKKWIYWSLLGILCGLAVWAKYQAPILFASMLIFLLITQEGRQTFRTVGPYLTLSIFLIVIAPHFIWSYQHNFPEMHYALQTTEVDEFIKVRPWLGHLFYPANNLVNVLIATAGTWIMALPFFTSSAHNTQSTEQMRFNRLFVYILGLCPFLLSMLFSIVSGGKLVHRWNTPYFTLLGLMLMLWLRPAITLKTFKQFMALFFIVASLMFFGRYTFLLAWPYISHQAEADSYFPAQTIANRLTNIWHQRYGSQLKYIAGEHYLTAYISVYSPDKPTPYMNWSKEESPWVNEQQLRKDGAIFAWPVHGGYTTDLPNDIKQRFPTAVVLSPMTFNKLTGAQVKPVEMGVAILPPQGSKQ